MKDNLERGSRVVFWLKVDFVLLLLLSIIMAIFINLFGIKENIDPETLMALDILGISLILFFICIVFSLLITLIISFIYWIKWLYRAIENVNGYSKTIFSPLLSVLLSVIPGLGFIFHFFILKDLVQKTELWLRNQKIRVFKIKHVLINSWFILMILNVVLDQFFELEVFKFVLGLTTLGLYISILSKYIKHESKLSKASREDEIRKQVEAVLEEREKEVQEKE